MEAYKMIWGTMIVGLVGIICVILGCLIWKKEKISLLHDYHYDKVSETDKKAFCTLSGLGIISVGTGLLITALILGITDSLLSFIAFAIGFVIGLALLIYAGNKYNSKHNV